MRHILFSLIVSLISLILVFYFPVTIKILKHDKNYSPYYEELQELQLKAQAGMRPSDPAWSKLEELREKNNQWFKDRKKNLKYSAKDAWEAWKKKSSMLAPGVMVLWGVSFFFFYKRRPGNQALLVLVFPVVLGSVQLMSLLEVLLIAFAVLSIWFWFIFNPPKSP